MGHTAAAQGTWAASRVDIGPEWFLVYEQQRPSARALDVGLVITSSTKATSSFLPLLLTQIFERSQTMSAAFRSLRLAKASPAARVAPRSAPVLQQRTIAMSAPRLRNPSDNRRGSEGTMAGSGSVSSARPEVMLCFHCATPQLTPFLRSFLYNVPQVDEIAHSEGAFSDNQTRPDQA